MTKLTKVFCYISIMSAGFFYSCKESSQIAANEEIAGSDLVEITPFVINRVMLSDTNHLMNFRGDMTARDYMEARGNHFLNQAGLNNFKEQIYYTLINPNSLIYWSPTGGRLTLKEKRDRFKKCDSLEESQVDARGKETISKVFLCDSTSFFYMLNAINFYEAWYYNKQTSEIVKKQLGYAIYQWDEDKEAFRELYLYFVSEETRKKALKYL